VYRAVYCSCSETFTIVINPLNSRKQRHDSIDTRLCSEWHLVV
jgi:hypothetical protein